MVTRQFDHPWKRIVHLKDQGRCPHVRSARNTVNIPASWQKPASPVGWDHLRRSLPHRQPSIGCDHRLCLRTGNSLRHPASHRATRPNVNKSTSLAHPTIASHAIREERLHRRDNYELGRAGRPRHRGDHCAERRHHRAGQLSGNGNRGRSPVPKPVDPAPSLTSVGGFSLMPLPSDHTQKTQTHD